MTTLLLDPAIDETVIIIQQLVQMQKPSLSAGLGMQVGARDQVPPQSMFFSENVNRKPISMIIEGKAGRTESSLVVGRGAGSSSLSC